MNKISFIDSCVVFNKLLGEDRHRTRKFFEDVKEDGINILINSSVWEECEKKIDQTFRFIMETLKLSISEEFIKHIKYDGRTEEDLIKYEDIKLLEDIFIWNYYVPKRKGKNKFKEPLTEKIRKIERELVYYLEQVFKKNLQLNVSEFLISITSEMQKQKILVLNEFEDLEIDEESNIMIIDEPYNESVFEDIEKSIGIHKQDAVHVSSTISYMEKNKAKVIFVTTDYGILGRKRRLKISYGLDCTNPLYAKNYF